MNERIRELAEQAMVETQHEFGGKYLAFSKEKFAELIVKECIKETISCSMDTKHSVSQDRFARAEHFLKHFGIVK